MGDLGKEDSPLWPTAAEHTHEQLASVFIACDSAGTA